MKVEVKEKVSDIKYPCIMKSDDTFVLFSGPSIGVCLTDTKGNPLGSYAEDWIMDIFKPFNGSITISND